MKTCHIRLHRSARPMLQRQASAAPGANASIVVHVLQLPSDHHRRIRAVDSRYRLPVVSKRGGVTSIDVTSALKRIIATDGVNKVGLSFTVGNDDDDDDDDASRGADSSRRQEPSVPLTLTSLRLVSLPTLVLSSSFTTGSHRQPDLLADHVTETLHAGSSVVDPETGRCVRCGVTLDDVTDDVSIESNNGGRLRHRNSRAERWSKVTTRGRQARHAKLLHNDRQEV